MEQGVSCLVAILIQNYSSASQTNPVSMRGPGSFISSAGG